MATQIDKDSVFYKILNGLDVCVYITDCDTHEILYVNEKMEREFGQNGLVGKVCWQALQSKREYQCDNCPVRQLVKDKEHKMTIQWEEHNSLNGRYYANTDSLVEWIDGRKVHLQHKVDITLKKLNQLEKKVRLNNQAFLLNLAMMFALEGESQTILSSALNSVGAYHSADCVRLYRKDEISGLFTLFNKYERMPTNRKDATFNLVVPYYDTVMALNPAFVMGDDQTTAIVPLVHEEKVWGLIIIEGTPSLNEYEYDPYLLKMEANIILTGLMRILHTDEIIKRDKELIKSAKIVERANSAKSDFLSRVSHEIKTPLNAIIGLSRISSNLDDLNRVQGCVGRIEKSALDLLAIVNDMLDISKIESSRLELLEGNFNLEKCILDSYNLVEARAKEKRHTIQLNIENIVPLNFVGDKLRLSQVVANLLSNAIKFSPVGSTSQLNVSVYSADKNSTVLLFEVADNGIGISEENQKGLFRAFEQVSGGIDRRYEGMGLGLAISKKIVKLMGGEIWLDSTEGKGSSFKFTARLNNFSDELTLPKRADKNLVRILALTHHDFEYFSHLKEKTGLDIVATDSFDNVKTLIEMAQAQNKTYNVLFADCDLGKNNYEGFVENISTVRTKYGTIPVFYSKSKIDSLSQQAESGNLRYFVLKLPILYLAFEALKSALGFGNEQDKIPDLTQKKVLLACHDDSTAELIEQMLKPSKAIITRVSKGTDALEEFEKQDFALALIDVDLPVLDGCATTEKIRKLDGETATECTIIALTQSAFKEDAVRCCEAGMDDLIEKPPKMTELYKTINKYISEENYMNDEIRFADYQDFLPYIDVVEGLGRLANNKKMYARLLKTYIPYLDTSKLKGQIDENNLEEALRTAHALTGVSANLSIKATANASQKLEACIKSGGDHVADFATLEGIMQKTVIYVQGLISFIERELAQ